MARLPKNTKFDFDIVLRKKVTDFFDAIPTHDDFQNVELNQFPWYKYGNDSKKAAAVSAEGAAPKRLASEIARAEMTITTPPPAAGTPFGSVHGSGSARGSGQGSGGRLPGGQQVSSIPLQLGRQSPRTGPSPLGRDIPASRGGGSQGQGSSQRGGGSGGGAIYSMDGTYDYDDQADYDDDESSFESGINMAGVDSDADADVDDSQTLRQASMSPTLQYMERTSRYHGGYH